MNKNVDINFSAYDKKIFKHGEDAKASTFNSVALFYFHIKHLLFVTLLTTKYF
jgi:hypothetical protein